MKNSSNLEMRSVVLDSSLQPVGVYMHCSFEMRPILDGSTIKKAKKRGTEKRIATTSKRNDVRGRLAKGSSPATGPWENKIIESERKKRISGEARRSRQVHT